MIIVTNIRGYLAKRVHIAIVHRITLALFLISQAGCATEPGETTALGGVAGATLGAGLGAIIGNQVGDPGSGVALGGVAGALAGTMVANEMESSNRKLALQEEMSRRQRETLNSQQKALSELRSLDDDSDVGAGGSRRRDHSNRSSLPDTWSRSASYKGAASSITSDSNTTESSVTSASASPAEYRRLDKKSYNDVGDDIKASQVVAPVQKAEKNSGTRPSSIFSPVNSEKLAVVDPEAVQEEFKVNDEATVKEKPSKAVTSSVVAKKKVAPPYEPPKDKIGIPSPTSIMPEAVSGEAATELTDSLVDSHDQLSSKSYNVSEGHDARRDPQAKAVAELGIKAKEDKPSNVKEADRSIECKNAEIEANKSAQATEVPDKLFHLRRALRLCPSDPQYHYGLGKVYSTVGRTDDAKYEFQEALKVDPKFAPALKEIGTVSQ